MMDAPDLRVGPPRRWNAEIDGVRWLARLADKARAANNGTLGTYLYGHSPFDRALLAALRLDHDEFATIAAASASDAELASALRARDPDLRRARKWSAVFPKNFGWFLALIDIDDGYRSSPFDAAVKLGANVLASTVKRVMPSAFNDDKAGQS
ncbi:MAG TPA: DUF5069 domain-containing protein [Candidatus Tumulicola sp.]